MKKVKLYTSEHCAPCRQVKGFFKNINLPFEEIDISNGHCAENILSIPTISCLDNEHPIYVFEGWSVAIGNKVAKWYKKED